MDYLKISGAFVLFIFCVLLSTMYIDYLLLNPEETYLLEKGCIIPIDEFKYKTCQEVSVIIGEKIITVPDGFETDLASIPRLFWSIDSPSDGFSMTPAIIHDYLYTCSNFNRLFADTALYTMLIADGLSSFTALKFYFAVRMFGMYHYNKFPQNCHYQDISWEKI